jgi:hypothetical protein
MDAVSRPPAAVLGNELDGGRFEGVYDLGSIADHVGGALFAFRPGGHLRRTQHHSIPAAKSRKR